MMGRIGFMVFVAGLLAGSWLVSLVGFLIYEVANPVPLLAFLTSGGK
jgi:hypothetical protein